MRVKILFFIILFLLFHGSGHCSQYYRVTGVSSCLNMRASSSTEHCIVSKLPNGAIVRYIDELDPDITEDGQWWVEIEYEGMIGWVVGKYLEEIDYLPVEEAENKSSWDIFYFISYLWNDFYGYFGKILCIVISIALIVVLFYALSFFLHCLFGFLGGCFVGLLPSGILYWITGSSEVFKYSMLCFGFMGLIYALYVFWQNPKKSLDEVWEGLFEGGGGSSDSSEESVEFHHDPNGKFYFEGGGRNYVDYVGSGGWRDGNGKMYDSSGKRK